MDDYQEYARMAKLMTKIHALSGKKLQDSEKETKEENYNSDANDENKYDEEELKVEPPANSVKFHFHNNSNLDASMEEEKEPLQNLLFRKFLFDHKQYYFDLTFLF